MHPRNDDDRSRPPRRHSKPSIDLGRHLQSLLNACRGGLVLPQDVENTVGWVMLRVGEPKTRFKAARHQMARVEWEDLVKLVVAVFAKLAKNEKLWPWSAQSLRTRFKQLLFGLHMPAT